MAADSFHAAVEKSMRKNPPVTFPEFVEVVTKAKKRVNVLEMDATSFVQPGFSVSQYTLNKCKNRPYIENIRRIIVRKGCLDLLLSDSVANGVEVQSFSLFSKKQLKLVTTDEFDLVSSLKNQ